MDRASAFFCAAAVVATLGAAILAYPAAALSERTVERTTVAVLPEQLGSVQVGGGFGEIPVVDLMVYYTENPPAAPDQAAEPEPELHFGGC